MRINLMVLFLFTFLSCFAQEKHYASPVKIPLNLSANFGELRTNHFHSGIDIKTNREIGIPVNSVADGYISRIVVSPTGFGKALYINHPNGTTSVYGHLNSFRDDIEKYIKNIQYDKKAFKVDVQMKKSEFGVFQNEIIAYSGNSGSSGGPHLHFEIRDSKTEEPQNPLKFNFNIQDKTPPKIFSVMLVPLNRNSHVNYHQSKKSIPLVFYDGTYHLKSNPVIPVYGNIGFAVQANDYFDNSYNKCGIYSLQLKIDGELYYSFQMDEFSFDETRYINSLIDFEEYKTSGKRFIKAWKDPGNELSVYNYLKGNGTFEFKDQNTHQISFELTDTNGNSSLLTFKVRSIYKKIEAKEENYTKMFEYDKDNYFYEHEVKLEIQEGTLYNNVGFYYSTSYWDKDFFSNVHFIGNNKVPLHKPAKLKIKTKNLPEKFFKKALLVKVDTITGKFYSAGGNFESGWIVTSIPEFGDYAVAVDTIPPEINSLSIRNHKELIEPDRIRFKISDKLSGIKEIKGFIDGKWALFEYDKKNNLITHYFDATRFELNRQHELSLTVIDNKNNTATYEASFRR